MTVKLMLLLLRRVADTGPNSRISDYDKVPRLHVGTTGRAASRANRIVDHLPGNFTITVVTD